MSTSNLCCSSSSSNSDFNSDIQSIIDIESPLKKLFKKKLSLKNLEKHQKFLEKKYIFLYLWKIWNNIHNILLFDISKAYKIFNCSKFNQTDLYNELFERNYKDLAYDLNQLCMSALNMFIAIEKVNAYNTIIKNIKLCNLIFLEFMQAKNDYFYNYNSLKLKYYNNYKKIT